MDWVRGLFGPIVAHVFVDGWVLVLAGLGYGAGHIDEEGRAD